MDRLNQVPKILLAIGLIVAIAIGYDQARPFLAKWRDSKVDSVAAPITATPALAAPAPVEPQISTPLVSPSQPRPGQSASLAVALSNELGSGKWAVSVWMPSVQDQTGEHDAVLLDMRSENGPLYPLLQKTATAQFVHGIDDPNKDVPGGATPEAVTKGQGFLSLYDVRDSKHPRLVYAQSFPYHGRSGEYPADWTSSQVLAGELTKALHRWNDQISHLNQ